jgi:hypothetical protein
MLIAVASMRTVAVSAPSPSDPQREKHDVADRVEATLRQASYLEIEGTIHQFDLHERGGTMVGGREPVTFRSRMAERRFRTDVYRNGGLVAAFSLLDGRIQEYRPAACDRPLLEYDAPYSNGAADSVNHEEYDCLIGTEMQSWVRVEPNDDGHTPLDHAAFLARTIREAQREADAVVEGQACFVYRRIFPPLPDDDWRPPEHALYIDKHTFLVRRWDTLNSGVHRIRYYQLIEARPEPPADVPWRIAVGDGAEKTPVAAVSLEPLKGWFDEPVGAGADD